MDDTPNLKLPYIMAAQAQKHVTHNEAIRALDAVVQLGVLDRDLTAPPGTPTNGDRYIVKATATGDWSGQEDNIAHYGDNAWLFYAAKEGWISWVDDEDVLLVYSGTAWVPYPGEIQNTPLFGVNATADIVNRLSVSSPAILFNHEGNGVQVKVSKAGVADTASFLFQNNFSGRAEIGLTGDDDFHFKVSPDGLSFTEAIVINKNDGAVMVPRLLSGSIIIADDAVGSIVPPYAGGFILITITDANFPQATHSGILVFDTGGSLALATIALAPSMSNLAGATLTGTTGTDGRSSVAVSSGNINIENRFGSTRTYSYTFIG